MSGVQGGVKRGGRLLRAARPVDSCEMSEVLPRRLGEYELLEVLGAGALTTTYLARRDRSSVSAPEGAGSELVSLKVLRPFSDVSSERAALRREADMQELCAHPGVVRVVDRGFLDAGLATRQCFMARAYVEGFAVSELLAFASSAGQKIPFEVVVALVDALLAVLGAVHEAGAEDGRVLGLIHRDVTPSNVLLGLRGVVYLTDFGLAHAPGAWGLLSDEEIAQGTPRYLTPEAARGEQPDGRSDLFQVALVVLELLGHGVRRSAVSLPNIARERLHELSFLDSAAAGALGPLLRRALDADPPRRFGTAADMLEALRRRFPSEDAARDELLRGWLESAFPAQVAAERARATRGLAVASAR